MPATIPENELRDRLAADIRVLQAGLTLLAKEQYIPNTLGTRSFIDLVARDEAGLLVLIELKRSGPASREAIHEILKYVEGVKAHFAVQEHELRVIIASTEWGELIVPFSRFLTESSIQVTGLVLDVTDTSIKSTKVEALTVREGRIIAPWHEVRFYETKKHLRQGIADIQNRYESNGIDDYVQLILHVDDAKAAKHQEQVRSVLSMFRQDQSSDEDLIEAPSLPKYSYCLYVASQLLNEVDYWKILKNDAAAYETAREETENMQGEELLRYLHDSVSAMGPEVLRGYFEIGYAAKLKSRLLEDEHWEIWGLLRYGAFERNALLKDETIVEELCGSEGHTGQSFSRDFVTSNKSQMKSAREGIIRCLEHNAEWKMAVLLALDEVEVDYPNARVELRIYNPSMGLLTIYHALSKEDGLLYLPGYRVSVFQGDRQVRAYAGCLVGERAPCSFNEILSLFYEGSIGGLMLSFSWGGYTTHDVEILNACGISYSSMKRDLPQDPLQMYKLDGKNWMPTEPPSPVEAFLKYMGNPSNFLNQLMSEISSRDHGGFFEF